MGNEALHQRLDALLRRRDDRLLGGSRSHDHEEVDRELDRVDPRRQRHDLDALCAAAVSEYDPLPFVSGSGGDRLDRMEKVTGPFRVCLTGAESTGKTELAKELAAHFGAPYVPEFSRQYA